MITPPPHSVEEQLDYILDLMRASDNVRIRRKFRSYEKPQDEICEGAVQLSWSGPVLVTEIINNALVRVEEYGVKNPQTYMAYRSKVRIAKRFGQKDVDPLFKLPRLPAEAIRDLADELSEFELPARQSMPKLLTNFILNHLKFVTGGRITAAASRQTLL